MSKKNLSRSRIHQDIVIHVHGIITLMRWEGHIARTDIGIVTLMRWAGHIARTEVTSVSDLFRKSEGKKV